jgi:cysteine desulfurase
MAETLLQLRPLDPDGPAAQGAAAADALRRLLRHGLASAGPDIEVHGRSGDAAAGAVSAPHIVAASAMYCDGQALVAGLDEAGFAVHSGSSCATTSGEPSHVLVAMGALTHGHVRVSVGVDTTEEDARAFVVAFSEVVGRLRAASLGP